MHEQYVFIWNVPSAMKWRELHGLIHTKVIKVDEMSVHERDEKEKEKVDTKVAILRVYSTTDNHTLERLINEMEMSDGVTMSATVETSLYIFFIAHYSLHTPNFIRQNLRDVNMRVDEGKEIIRCEFTTYGQFMRAFSTVEAMMANNVRMKLYRYEKGGNKLPPPSILSLKFNSIPPRFGDCDSDLVSYSPPSTHEINTWIMEQDYNMWNAFHAVSCPSMRKSSNEFDGWDTAYM